MCFGYNNYVYPQSYVNKLVNKIVPISLNKAYGNLALHNLA